MNTKHFLLKIAFCFLLCFGICQTSRAQCPVWNTTIINNTSCPISGTLYSSFCPLPSGAPASFTVLPGQTLQVTASGYDCDGHCINAVWFGHWNFLFGPNNSFTGTCTTGCCPSGSWTWTYVGNTLTIGC